MKKTHLDTLSLCSAELAGPFSCAVADTMRAGQPDLTRLEQRLNDLGFVIHYEDLTNGSWAWVTVGNEPKGSRLAQGYAQDRDEALLHAVLGAVREEHARKVVAAELIKAGVQVDAELRQHLESRFIRGGAKQLGEDMKAFSVAKKV